MSILLKPEKKLSTSFNFSRIPAVENWDLHEITPAEHSDRAPSATSSNRSSASPNVDREEPCFVTKSSCFTHEKAHWVNAVRKNRVLKAEIEGFLINDLKIVRLGFGLDHPSNLSHLDCSLHASLDKYAFFAITGSLETLTKLIELFRRDNEARQEYVDQMFVDRGRLILLNDLAIVEPSYELVALHPKHMLPDDKVLVAYTRDPQSGRVTSKKLYVAGSDNTLREWPGDIECGRFPSFSFDYDRLELRKLNPLLVVLNAEIKFRRYLRCPPPFVMPPEVQTLIQLTMKLVEMIYFKPVIRPGTEAMKLFVSKGGSLHDENESLDAEMGYVEEKQDETTLRPCRAGRGIKRPAPDATLQERMEYGQYLLSGRDLDLDSDDEQLLEDLGDEEYQPFPHTQSALARQEGAQAWKNVIQT